MLNFNNKKIYYTMGNGVGVAENELNAFDRALLTSGSANYNLISISSILPGGAQFVSKINYKEGSLLPVAIAKKIIEPTEKKIMLAAAVAIGIPEDKNEVGIIMEWAGIATEDFAKEKVLSMVSVAMKDREISNYSTKVSSVERESSSSEFVCVLAYVALLPQ